MDELIELIAFIMRIFDHKHVEISINIFELLL